MAVTKIKAIKSTLSKAIDYICNPKKTEGGLLVDSFGCVAETAAAEMRITANKGTNIGSRVAYHLIQSFSPDDPITPEQALEIGKKFASQITEGKYEYVIATHVDRGHIHNHIIFNSVNFVNYRKYQYDKCGKEKERIQGINDKLCRENGLSVIETRSGRRGKNYKEYQESKEGTSWKDILADLIDKAVSEAASFEEFLKKMELEGVDVKLGKHISFKCGILGQERRTRGKRIGEGYTEESIRARIENDENYLNEHRLKISKEEPVLRNENTSRFCKENIITPSQKIEVANQENHKAPIKSTMNRFYKNKNINLIVETSKLEKAINSQAYANAVNRSNLSNLVKSMNFLSAHNLQTSDDLIIFEDGVRSAAHIEERNLKNINNELAALREKIKFAQNYKKNKSVYIEYRRGGSNIEFYNKHQDEIDSYQLAKLYFDKKGIDSRSLKLNELFDLYRSKKSEKEECEKNAAIQKSLLRDTVTVRKNYENALHIKLTDEEIASKESVEKNTRKKSKMTKRGDIEI